MRPLALALLASVLPLAACDSSDTGGDAEPLAAARLADVPADPTTGRDPNTGAPTSTGRFTFVRLRDGAVVLSSADANRADSASTAWDLGFRGTTIIANGGTRGPGQGGLAVVDGLFEEVTEAPATGYAFENSAALADSLRWYNYNPAANVVTPRPGRVLVVRTADGRYAKVRLLSYYRGGVASPTAADDPRYYTFEYVYQPDGSRDLDATAGAD